MSAQFVSWCVYHSPKDYPGLYVARRWLIEGSELIAADVAFTSPTLAGIRAQLPPGLHCIARLPGDDPCIFETWI